MGKQIQTIMQSEILAGHELKKHSNTYAMILDQVERTKEIVIRLGQDLKAAGDKSDGIDKLEDSLKDCITLKHKADGVRKTIEQITIRPEDPTARQRLETAFDATLETSFEYDGAYQRFQKRARGVDAAANEESDDDLQIEERELTEIPRCPVTGGEIKDPVKNSECGHNYSKSGIEGLLRQQASRDSWIKCPAHGCSKKVKLSTLSKNYELATDIEKILKHAVKAEETATTYTQL